VRNLVTYKPRKTGDGVASEFNVSEYKGKTSLMLNLSKQVAGTAIEDAKFDWKGEKLTVKLNETEAASMIAVLNGSMDGLGERGLYHKHENGDSSIQLKWDADKKYHLLQVGKKRGNDWVRLGHSLGAGEAVLLQEYLKLFLHTAFSQEESWKKKADTNRNGQNQTRHNPEPEPAVMGGDDDDSVPF
jgi:hypothetical protein